MSLIKTYLHNLQSQTQMNYTLKQLQDRVSSMIKETALARNPKAKVVGVNPIV